MASDELAAKLARRINKCEGDGESNNEIDAVLSDRKASVVTTESETNELANKLSHRLNFAENPDSSLSTERHKVFNPYTEFPELSRKDIKKLQESFNKFDDDKDKFIGFEDLKRMMEKLGSPQTHLGLKEMIAELDEDKDGKISFREFLMLFRRARAGEFQNISGLRDLFDKYIEMEEISVGEVGVKEAGNFFQSKINAQLKAKTFEEEIRQEQEEKARQAAEARERKERFKQMKSTFQ